MAAGKLLVYLLRRDLRASDNPILHHLTTSKEHKFTHVLPLYIFPAHQVEISGFLTDGARSPYPEAVSAVGKFWRCGSHRAKFLAQSVWDIKNTLEGLGSGLLIRVGSFDDVMRHLISSLTEQGICVSSVWMTEENSYEEEQDQKIISNVCSNFGVDFDLWPDKKYYVDDQDTGLAKPADLPDVYTDYRKAQEPLRDRPRDPHPRALKGSLPPFPDLSSIPPQASPFVAVDSLKELERRLLAPLGSHFENPPSFPKGAVSAHPFQGGESTGWKRLQYLINTGSMKRYTETRNGLIGADFSSKLSAFLALGSLSARQIHHELLKYENGVGPEYAGAPGYGDGENQGTRGIRFELLWRDYMRLCTLKFGRKMFRLSGFRGSSYPKMWKSATRVNALPNQKPSPSRIGHILERFIRGTTGMGLIDASQRELYHTGYTSNRARQNVASFLAKHLQIDWRYGAELYEMLLVDYDVSSNWANWLYVAGVGNDPRGESRVFNPVKQAYDYDKEGHYIRMWVPELKLLENVANVFQLWTANPTDLQPFGLEHSIMFRDPIRRIQFSPVQKRRAPRKARENKSRNKAGARQCPQAQENGLNRVMEGQKSSGSDVSSNTPPGQVSSSESNQTGDDSSKGQVDTKQTSTEEPAPIVVCSTNRDHPSRANADYPSRANTWAPTPGGTYVPPNGRGNSQGYRGRGASGRGRGRGRGNWGPGTWNYQHPVNGDNPNIVQLENGNRQGSYQNNGHYHSTLFYQGNRGYNGSTGSILHPYNGNNYYRHNNGYQNDNHPNGGNHYAQNIVVSSHPSNAPRAGNTYNGRNGYNGNGNSKENIYFKDHAADRSNGRIRSPTKSNETNKPEDQAPIPQQSK